MGSNYQGQTVTGPVYQTTENLWDGNNKIRERRNQTYTHTNSYGGTWTMTVPLTAQQIAELSSGTPIAMDVTGTGDFIVTEVGLIAQTAPVSAVPLPATGTLLGAALGAVALRRNRRAT